MKTISAAFLGTALLLALPAVAQEPSPPPPVTEPAPPAPPAKAGDLIQRLKGDQFIALLTEVGWTVKQTGEKDGAIYFAGAFTDAESGTAYEFEAGLYRCEGSNGCYDIVFTRSFESATPVTLKMINDYNMKQIFGCAYLTADGKVGLSLSHTIQGGVTNQTVKEIADWWKTIVIAYPGKLGAG